MKAPRHSRPAPQFQPAPAREPAGASQLRVDESDRHGAQREYLDGLHAGETATLGRRAVQRASAGQTPAQLAKGKTKTTPKAKKAKTTKTAKGLRYGRFTTAYGVTTATGNQGPHTIPHVAKVLAVENAQALNPGFSVDNIRERSGLIPSAGQARKLVGNVEKATNTKISKPNKVRLDRHYKRLLAARKSGSPEERQLATLKLLELNPIGTYSLHQPASHDELKGKGERRTTVKPDLVKMSNMTKGGPVPTFSKVDLPQIPQHSDEHVEKYLRDTGKLYKGEDDHSDLDLSSADEYSSDDDG